MTINNKILICLISVLLLFIILPSCFAADNLTEIDDNSLDLSLDSNHDDVLSGKNDYYFNASVDMDGDGSQAKPYKYLTNDKLVENAIIHLSDGEYELDDGKTVNTISIIGESSKNTIVKFKNNNSILTSMNKLTLKNLTFVDVTIINYATLNADNVIFRDATGYLQSTEGTNIVNSATNSFGGAIYGPSSYYSTPEVNINNCMFINNTAEYGGAIYMDGGNLDIKNSLFYNNYAYNYGGTIAAESNSKVNIERSRFFNSISINDAGGAIYVKSSKLTANNMTIENSTATFGGAIASLSSTLTVNIFDAFNNVAKYEGGAIYQFYGTLTTRFSNFENNSASNGGALFIDDTTSTILYENTFTNNTALDCGGAVYSLLNEKFREEYCQYHNNTASCENDFYNTDTVSLLLGSGNYTLYINNLTFSGEIPSNYSSIDNGYVTSIKDQQNGGNCWAFAGLAVLESCILKASGDNIDLSEENMKNLMGLYSDYGWYMDTNEGGYPSMIMGYLTSWMGPVLEENDLYDDYSTLSPLLNSVVHVQNIKYFSRSSYTDNDEIKKAIMTYGAVGSGIYYDSTYFNKVTNSYYGSITTGSNHAVAIVGWDDNFSKNNFVNRPRGNGAWIVKNSWNTDWGDEGFFYVSYYDTSMAPINDKEAVYTFILNDTIKYDKNYQYDIQGITDYFLTGSKNVWYQNIFNATDNEFLAAVSTFFEKDCSWDLSIYVNNELKLVKNGIGESGYYTIDLGEYIPLNVGDIFKVVFKITSNSATFPISEKIKTNKVIYLPGTSFFSTDGKKWIDLYDYTGSYSSHTYSSQVACIKAFTFIDEIVSNITLSISNNGYNPVNIVANVLNQYGNPVSGGNVTFTINGKTHTIGVVNGMANLRIDLEEMATSYIDAVYNCGGYISSHVNGSATINKKTAHLDLEVIQYAVTTTINVNISKKINETVFISINDMLNYTVNATDGIASLVLENLKSGNYTIKAYILNDVYVNTDASTEFNIDVKATKILASDFIAYYNGGNLYTVSLVDELGAPIFNREVLFTINGRSFKKITNVNGFASLIITLPTGLYNLDIVFNGDGNYINSSESVNVTVKSTIIPSEPRNYTSNSNYSISLLDNDGNKLNNTKVSITIDDVSHDLTTDENGCVIFDINLKKGKYYLYLINPITGEKFEDSINVFSRIIENKGFTMYFGSGSSYKVRVLDDFGNPVGAGEKITFKINGKSYTRSTDNNGYASFKITLTAKTYTITAEYKGFKVSNKIIVKPVLTAKNISKKKAKVIKFSAKLVNTKGKALKNKKITFKINKKKYTVKTNKKGVATLKLKNLKVGKTVIYSSYGKSKIKNTIKIRK